jgi:hypothetical protein
MHGIRKEKEEAKMMLIPVEGGRRWGSGPSVLPCLRNQAPSAPPTIARLARRYDVRLIAYSGMDYDEFGAAVLYNKVLISCCGESLGAVRGPCLLAGGLMPCTPVFSWRC